MSDINCAVCGEPWDAYGMRHGDMRPWEYELFRQGAGCPTCEGRAPAEGVDHTLSHMRSIILDGATDDPDAFVLTVAPDAPRPAWKRPEDPILWSCPGCDTTIKRDLDSGDPYWNHPSATRYFHHLPRAFYDAPPADPAAELPKIADANYCPACAEQCDRCATGVFKLHASVTNKQLYTDSYAPGASFGFPDDVPHETLCIDCYEKATSDAEAEAREEREASARNRAVEDEIIEGFARAIFCVAWAQWAEEYDQLPHGEILEYAPATHPAAILVAEGVIREIERLNNATIEDLAVRAFTAGEEHEHRWGRLRYEGASTWSEVFGFALGREWLGEGAHWTDNHPEPDQPIEVPFGEFHVSNFADTVCGWREPDGRETGCRYLATETEFREHPIPPPTLRPDPGFRCPNCGAREEIYEAFPAE